jgi:hypothetical protein
MHGRYERNPGRIVELQPGDSRDVLDLRWKDEIAHVICVTLVGPAEGVPAGCVALVQWGAGEAEAEAEIDFGVGGVVFTLPASSIRITARCDFGPSPVEFATPPIFRVGAFASVGSGGRTSRLTRTRFLHADIAAGASVLVDVPPFAKALRVLGGDEATRSLQLAFNGVEAGLYTVEVPPGAPAPQVDLAPDVTTIELTNMAGATLPAGARAIFELGI